MKKEKSNRTLKQNINLIIRGLRLYAAFPKPALLSRLIQTIANSLIPFMNIYLSSLILNELAGERDKEQLTFLVILTAVLNLIVYLVKAVIDQWTHYCGWEIWRVPYKAFTDKLFSMDYADLENSKIQEEYSKVYESIQSLGFGLPRLYANYDQIIAGIIQITVSVVMSFSMFTLRTPKGSLYVWLDSPFAVMAVLTVLALSIFLAPYIGTRGGKAWAKSTLENKQHNRVYQHYFFGVGNKIQSGMDIRIYDQKRLIDKGVSFLETNSWTKHGISAGRLYALSAAVTFLCNGFIYLFVALKAFAGAFGVGSIVRYVGAITQFGGGFATIFGCIGSLATNNDFLESTFRFLDKPNKKYQGTLSVEKRDDNEYEIEFKNVSFKYPNSEIYALKNFNYKFNIGKRVAVVGMNGSGKTTMIKLLCRLYDPDEGVITLNGLDIKKYNYGEYMALFSVVFQDFKLLPFSLGENVATSIDYDEMEITRNLEKIGFKQRLDKMPDGLNTYLYKNFDENGVDISGGEAQKIALARALYKNAPFIILDEPTAALDPIAEFEIYSKFNEIVGGKTAVFISHRLSSCRFCDDIAVFHEGEMIQRGSHDELLCDMNGKYFELWNAQAQYYHAVERFI